MSFRKQLQNVLWLPVTAQRGPFLIICLLCLAIVLWMFLSLFYFFFFFIFLLPYIAPSSLFPFFSLVLSFFFFLLSFWKWGSRRWSNFPIVRKLPDQDFSTKQRDSRAFLFPVLKETDVLHFTRLESLINHWISYLFPEENHATSLGHISLVWKVEGWV